MMMKMKMRLSWEEVLLPMALALAMAFVVVGPSSMVAEAQQQIPTSCNAPLANLQPCLTYITVGGNTSAPGPPCCTPLNNTLSSNDSSTCLCLLLSNNATVSSFNVTRAQEIAADCKVTIPAAVQLCLTNTSSTSSTTSSNTTSPGSSSSSPLLNAEGWSLSITIFSVLGIYVCSSWFIF